MLTISLGRLASLVLAGSSLAFTGCATYTVPGRAADLTLFAEDVVLDEETGVLAAATDIDAIFAREPLARFPATLALVRVQAPDYASHTVRASGEGGAYSVVTTRDVETEADLSRLAALPGVGAVAPFNRLLLGGDLRSDLELREAAARLHADVLLLYTFDTSFYLDGTINPLSVLTLGLLPTEDLEVTTTAAALLLDVRSGFVYGVAESTADDTQGASVFDTAAAMDGLRRGNEREAFEQLLGEIELAWGEVNARFGAPQ